MQRDLKTEAIFQYLMLISPNKLYVITFVKLLQISKLNISFFFWIIPDVLLNRFFLIKI